MEMNDFDPSEEGRTHMVQIGRVELNPDDHGEFNPDSLPLLPTRNLVMFPGVTSPITVVRDSSLKLAEFAQKHKLSIGIVCQTKAEEETPEIGDLYKYGVIADILQIINLPDGGKAIIVHAHNKIKIEAPVNFEKLPGVIAAKVKVISDFRINEEKQPYFNLLVETIREKSMELFKMISPDFAREFMMNTQNLDNPILEINMLATNFPLQSQIKISMLKERKIDSRAQILLEEIEKQLWGAKEKEKIQQQAKRNMDEQSRNAFLQMQLDTIKHELYGDDNDADTLLKRAETVNFPDDIRKVFDREIEKLRRLNPQSPDYSVLFSYLETLLDLPWLNVVEGQTDFNRASEILEAEHFGLEKVKQRILEELAMIISHPKGKSPIICLVGPPGVGKTSIGRSIASALGREYQRISLGGLHDESEIRGHRRTYIGAMPGRIIDALKRCKTSNPVLLLDEIDKIGKDYKGDPSAALLEVLDPEQNCRFHDNYIDVDYDLSSVLFIATANTLSTVSQPLIDRMEVIEIPGYLLEEKIEIGRRHLLPRILQESGMEQGSVELSDNAFRKIIENYTAESGVRQLEKNIASLIRKIVLDRLRGNNVLKELDSDTVRKYLGVERFTRDTYEGNDFAGVVAGLAWTSVGGEILFIESSLSEGKDKKLTLTGNLGDVMKESAMIALQYVKSHAKELGINPEDFENKSIHIHVPEGAIPKDGPSAGITMATSIASAFTGRKVKKALAMTGEITLRGKVLPVGGIREKILAAKRAGITEVILSKANRKDFEEINPAYIEGLNFIFVDTVREVIEISLTDEKA